MESKWIFKPFLNVVVWCSAEGIKLDRVPALSKWITKMPILESKSFTLTSREKQLVHFQLQNHALLLNTIYDWNYQSYKTLANTFMRFLILAMSSLDIDRSVVFWKGIETRLHSFIIFITNFSGKSILIEKTFLYLNLCPCFSQLNSELRNGFRCQYLKYIGTVSLSVFERLL